MVYQKPTAEAIRKASNGFGGMSAKKMMSLRTRTTKIILMDYANYLLKEKKMTPLQVNNAVTAAINSAIEAGLCTVAMKETLNRFITKHSKTVDPIMKLHCAVTMEALEETGGKDNVDPSSLPQEVQDAAECGPDCLGGTRPSIERLSTNVSTQEMNLFRTVGGTLCDYVFRTIGSSMDNEYLSER